MKVDDPLRPQIGNKPGLLSGGSIVPNWTVNLPGAEDEVSVILWVPVGFNRFAPKWVKMQLEELPGKFQEYCDDPEGWLVTHCGWDQEAAKEKGKGGGSPSIPAPPPPRITLAAATSDEEDLF